MTYFNLYCIINFIEKSILNQTLLNIMFNYGTNPIMNKMNKKQSSNEILQSSLFFIIPTVMLIFGYLAIPYPIPQQVQQIMLFPLFIGLILLGIGYFWKKKSVGSKIKIIGWTLFSFTNSHKLSTNKEPNPITKKTTLSSGTPHLNQVEWTLSGRMATDRPATVRYHRKRKSPTVAVKIPRIRSIGGKDLNTPPLPLGSARQW